MRIGIMGDSHGDSYSIKRAVQAARNVDLWLHTGDYYRDGAILACLTNLEVIAVAGNCDGRINAKPDEFVDVGGYRLWLTHGHRYGVKYDLTELRDWADRFEVDIVVFGHTHQSFVAQESGLLLFNTGSTALPRRGASPTCGILELVSERKEILPRLISIC